MGMLDGKVAIVTGAGNGVGRGEAVQLADHGAKVVVNDLGGSVTGEGADKSAAETVVDVIKGRGGEAVANYDDVSDHAAAKNIILSRRMPALLTSTSSLPKASIAVPTMFLAPSKSATLS